MMPSLNISSHTPVIDARNRLTGTVTSSNLFGLLIDEEELTRPESPLASESSCNVGNLSHYELFLDDQD